jgi:hypothetical protein
LCDRHPPLLMACFGRENPTTTSILQHSTRSISRTPGQHHALINRRRAFLSSASEQAAKQRAHSKQSTAFSRHRVYHGRRLQGQIVARR